MKWQSVKPVSLNKVKNIVLTSVSILSLSFVNQSPANSQNNNVYVIRNPEVNGYYLDACRDWAANCGKPAADAYCQYQGYRESVKFLTENYRPTIVIGSKEVCNENYCARIKEVNCIY